MKNTRARGMILQPGEIPDVAVILDIGCIGQRMLAGISRYLRVHGPWNLYLDRGLAERADMLTHWRGHGIVARIRGSAVAQTLRRHDVPLVVDRPLPPSFLQRRTWQPRQIDLGPAPEPMICDYLIARGFTHFAFCPMPDGGSWGRQEPFIRSLAKRGFSCRVFSSAKARRTDDRVADHRQLAAWLTHLPKPIAVVAANDPRAYEIIEICRGAHLSVPNEIAVLGFDNDVAMCDLCNPTLTSVEAPAEEAGYRAAATLHALMLGQKPPEFSSMPPSRLIVRRSTDVIATDDPDLRQALELIFAHATSGLTVKELLHELALSRRSLERLFLKTLGHGPGTEIRRLQVQKAQQLLAETGLSILDVARHAGFANATRLGEALRRQCDMTPLAYRQKYRA